MIDAVSYTSEWIETMSKQNRNTDKNLIEKVIRALGLLLELKNSDIDFIFKGGTALMLMLNKPTRLSIDIDIIVENKDIDLETIFEKICSSGLFVRYSKNERIKANLIEKAHYKFYYNPTMVTHSKEDYVILDILFENNPYSALTQTAVQSQFIKISSLPQTVKTPLPEEILGDKLTAFAPTTTGIPYYKGKQSMSMEIVKQLYDIGNLFDAVSQIQSVKTTFEKIALNELRYRNLMHLNSQDVLNDIIETAICISTRGMAGNCMFTDLQLGIKRISGFIYSGKYIIEDAIVSASKAAYLASLIKHNQPEIIRHKAGSDISALSIETTNFNKMNKLKRGLPEAFWYWYQIYLLESV